MLVSMVPLPATSWRLLGLVLLTAPDGPYPADGNQVCSQKPAHLAEPGLGLLQFGQLRSSTRRADSGLHASPTSASAAAKPKPTTRPSAAAAEVTPRSNHSWKTPSSSQRLECWQWPCWPLKRSASGCCVDPLNSESAVLAALCVLLATSHFLWMLAGWLRGVEAERPPRGPEVQCLEGLRTLACLLFVLAYSDTGLPASQSRGFPALVFEQHRLRGVHAVVQAMFVTSGFLLVHSTKGSTEPLDRRSGLAFVLRRLGRISPAYCSALLLEMLLFRCRLNTDTTPLAWPLKAAYMESLCPVSICHGQGSSLLPQQLHPESFSVSALVLVTFCFPTLYNMIRQLGVWACIWLMVLSAIFRSGVTAILCGLCSPSAQVSTVLYIAPLLRIPDFFVGMLGGQLWKAAPVPLTLWNAWGWLLDACLLLVIALVLLSPLAAGDDSRGGDFYLALPVSCLCICATFSERPIPGEKSSWGPTSGVLGRIVAFWPLATMGKYAYTTFMLLFSSQRIVTVFMPSRLWISWVLSTGLGVLAYHIVQQPCRRMLEWRLEGEPD